MQSFPNGLCPCSSHNLKKNERKTRRSEWTWTTRATALSPHTKAKTEREMAIRNKKIREEEIIIIIIITKRSWRVFSFRVWNGRTTSRCVKVAVVMAFTWLRRILPRSNLHRPPMKENLFFLFFLYAPGSTWLSTHTMILLSLFLSNSLSECVLFIFLQNMKKKEKEEVILIMHRLNIWNKTPGGRKPRLYPHRFFVFFLLLLVVFVSPSSSSSSSSPGDRCTYT